MEFYECFFLSFFCEERFLEGRERLLLGDDDGSLSLWLSSWSKWISTLASAYLVTGVSIGCGYFDCYPFGYFMVVGGGGCEEDVWLSMFRL